MSDPYSYTDPQNHRMQVLTTVGASGRPYVWLEADNLAIGGATVSVWLPVAEARELADQLDNQAASGHVDHTGDTLAVEPADDWTRFTFTHVEAYDDDQPRTVPVVVLTARLPEVATALRAAADQAKADTRIEEPTHEGPDPSHGGLTTHRGTREQCSGPDCGPESCERHLDAPRIGGLCGGCTIVPPAPDPLAYGPTGIPCGCGKPAHSNLAPCQLDAVEEEQAAPVLTDSVRQFLTFALNCAAEEMDDRADEFGDADEAALEALRRIATGAEQARRVLTEAEYTTTYTAARRAFGRYTFGTVSPAVDEAVTAALATVGILTPPPDPEPDTCPAQFADLAGEWHQCAEEPGHDPADGHDDGEWSWPDGETQARPEPDEEQQP